eukprot:Gb_09518 [translate_table: standard]
MEISTVGSLRISSPLASPRGPSSPLKTATVVMNSPSALLSPRSSTCSPISCDPETQHKRVFRTSASFNGRSSNSGDCVTEEHRDVMLFANKSKNHYALLGVPNDASHNDIRLAYRRLALQYHPDVMPLHQLETATNFFSEINHAYDTLSDPQKRKAYDDLHLAPRVYTAKAGGSSSFGQWRGRTWETDQCWCG